MAAPLRPFSNRDVATDAAPTFVRNSSWAPVLAASGLVPALSCSGLFWSAAFTFSWSHLGNDGG
jgi:hypothetical protein